MALKRSMVLPRMADYHVHLRQGPLCDAVAPWTAKYCDVALVMPNTEPPVSLARQVGPYVRACRDAAGGVVELRHVFMLTPDTSPADVRACREGGCVGGKLYPQGVTTHSYLGIPRGWLEKIPPLFANTLAALEEEGMTLHVHPELPGSFVLDSEAEFLVFFHQVRSLFPRLRIQVEHVTDEIMVRWVSDQPLEYVRATVTPHHLAWDLGCLFDGGLRPWRYCKPVYKYPADRAALLSAAVGDDHFFLGSDSAPHSVGKKFDAGLGRCCAGVWNAPVLPEVLTHIFDAAGDASSLPAFCRFRGDSWHRGGAVPSGELVLAKEPYTIPESVGGMAPMMAGETVSWRLTT